MESLMFSTLVQWLVYLVSACACYWAWNKMFFWLKQKDALIISRLFGAVLLFTPAPLVQGGNEYAPAFITIIFRGLLEKNANVFDPVIWMLSALFGGFIIVALWSLVTFLHSKLSAQN